MGKKASAEETIRTSRRNARRQYSADEKIRIVFEGLRGEDHIAALYHLGQSTLFGTGPLLID